MRDMVNTKVFVGSLPPGTRPSELRHMFETYGTVTECDIVNRCGFVHMETFDMAKNAIRALNGVQMKGQRIVVEHGRPKGSSYAGGGGGGGYNNRGNRNSPHSRDMSRDRRYYYGYDRDRYASSYGGGGQDSRYRGGDGSSYSNRPNYSRGYPDYSYSSTRSRYDSSRYRDDLPYRPVRNQYTKMERSVPYSSAAPQSYRGSDRYTSRIGNDHSDGGGGGGGGNDYHGSYDSRRRSLTPDSTTNGGYYGSRPQSSRYRSGSEYGARRSSTLSDSETYQHSRAPYKSRGDM